MIKSTILGFGFVACLCMAHSGFASLTAYWSFDTNFANQQGNTLLDGVPVGTASITHTSGEYQVGGGALRIDNAPGATDYVDITGNVLLGPVGSVVNTVVAWYLYEDISYDGSDERNFVWETAPSTWPLSFGIRDDGFDKYAQWYTDAPSTGGVLAIMPSVNDGFWHHAAIVIDEANDTLKYYHDRMLWDTAVIPNLALNRAGATGFHIGNHRAGDGGRNWDGYIDEVAVFNQLLTGTQIQGLYDKTIQIMDVMGTELSLTINRNTHAIAISNNTGSPIALDSYSISSAIGSFNSSGWNSITEHGDSNSGGSVDPAHTWSIEADLATHLAESSDSSSGATISDGQTVNLGAIWFPSPTEDIQFKYYSNGQEITTGSVLFSGNNAKRFDAGDLNFDGNISAADWTTFLIGHGGVFSTMSVAEAYGMGDLDGDLDNDMLDFVAFESLYDAANGAGALDALISGVPEPAAIGLFSMLLIAICGWNGFRQNHRSWFFKKIDRDGEDRLMHKKSGESRRPACRIRFGFLALIVAASLMASPGRADLVASWTFDNDFIADYGGLFLVPFNGATAGDPGGKFGNAATFERANSEYAFTSGNVLVQGPGQDHSYSVWYRLDVPDIIGTADRYFVLETTAGNSPSATGAYSVSYGLRDLGSGDVGQVFTITDLAVAPNVSFPAAGNEIWHNLIVTYDADGGLVNPGLHTIYLDGIQVASMENTDPLAAVEGLVIGGHREGTGRNWEGMIDDVGFFNHILTTEEISLLQTNSVQEFAPNLNQLTLVVDRGTGQVTITNTGDNTVNLNSYQIDSALGSLDPTNGTGWNSLDDQNLNAIGTGVGESWDEGGSSSAYRLIESFLLGSTELAADASVSVGNAYNESVDARDLQFRFNSVDAGPYAGIVEYIGQTAHADFDGDGDVDGADFLVWQRGFGITGTATLGQGDANNDKNVDSADLAIWRNQFGTGTGVSSLGSIAVPEPATWIASLLLIGTVLGFWKIFHDKY